MEWINNYLQRKHKYTSIVNDLNWEYVQKSTGIGEEYVATALSQFITEHG